MGIFCPFQICNITQLTSLSLFQALKNLPKDYAEKPWRTAELFAVLNRHNAFTNDGLNKTRPMSAPAETPLEVNNLFDRIAYAKAGSVLYMIEHILTTKVWKAGLKKYLTDEKK